MENILSLNWYTESPIDFEHKQYLLFSYLQKVDADFMLKKLSPHLLHMEKIMDELIGFQSSFTVIKKNFDKNRYVYFENVKLEGEDNSLLTEIREIVEFSLPQVEPRIKLGYKILKKNNQILF
jgi:hypothetical protein